jgi:hypothetical protein
MVPKAKTSDATTGHIAGSTRMKESPRVGSQSLVPGVEKKSRIMKKMSATMGDRDRPRLSLMMRGGGRAIGAAGKSAGSEKGKRTRKGRRIETGSRAIAPMARGTMIGLRGIGIERRIAIGTGSGTGSGIGNGIGTARSVAIVTGNVIATGIEIEIETERGTATVTATVIATGAETAVIRSIGTEVARRRRQQQTSRLAEKLTKNSKPRLGPSPQVVEDSRSRERELTAAGAPR